MGVVFNSFKSILKKSPLLFRPSCFTQYHLIRLISSVQKKKTQLRSEAPIEPFKLHQIDPSEVDVMLEDSLDSPRFEVQSPVVRGDWDLETTPLQEYDLFSSVYEHFADDVPWEETDFYHRVEEEIGETDDWFKWGCYDFEDFRARLMDLDELYENIRDGEYKTQRELRDSGGDPVGTRSCYPPGWHEVTVHIGRDGRYIFQEGRHRLAIAQALDLRAIPMRIMVRHRQWQRFRTRVYNRDGSARPAEHVDHPDISSLRQSDPEGHLRE